MYKTKKGFSLVEVVTTIIVIITLSLISGPIYNSYSTKAKEAEGYALLGAIRSAQDDYHRIKRNFYQYYTTTCYCPVLEIDARPNKYYTSFKIYSSEGSPIYYTVWVYGTKAKSLMMLYNRTTGCTIKYL